MAAVYALRNNETKLIFYVGCSSAETIRFKEHRASNPNISLVILEDFGKNAHWANNRRKFFTIEQWWINAFIRAGFTLTNRFVMKEEKVYYRLGTFA